MPEKSTLADYSPDEIHDIVATRCAELAPMLGWPVAPPTVRVVSPDALRAATDDDVRARGRVVRGVDREDGLLERVVGFLAGLFGPALLGYFGTSTNTLFLPSTMVPQQGAYVLLHELTHAAQWQNHPGLFALVDRERVATEDHIDAHGPDADVSLAARDRYESLVTLVEGHATLIGRRALEHRLRSQATGVSDDEIRAYVQQLTGLDPTDETTQLVYVRGEERLARMSSEEIDALFHDPEAAVRLFARRVG